MNNFVRINSFSDIYTYELIFQFQDDNLPYIGQHILYIQPSSYRHIKLFM